MLENKKMIDIYYEDLVDDAENQFKIIFDFFGLKHISPKTRTHKQNPESIDKLLINYSELKAHFKVTKWAEYFE
jgi:hypothetical protein